MVPIMAVVLCNLFVDWSHDVLLLESFGIQKTVELSDFSGNAPEKMFYKFQLCFARWLKVN